MQMKPCTEPHWFSYSCYACLGTFIQLGIWLGFTKLIRWLVKKISGKQLNKSTVTCIALIYSVSVAMYGLHEGSQLPEVKRVDIALKNLGKSFDGFKIVQISDIHLGPTVGRTRLQGIVNIVNSLEPDAVVLVGDLTDGSVEKLRLAASPLKDIKPKYGAYYVTGNHEYYLGDVDNWFEYLRTEAGFTVLHNSNAKIHSPRNDQEFFYFAGTDDVVADQMRYTGHGFHLDSALEGTDPSRAVILLAHQPAAAKRALDSKHTNIQLVLSGHTHGGQMFPISIGAWLVNPFFVGLYEYNGRQVYVSPGTVFWGIPIRIFTSMEVTEIVLKSV